MEFEFGALVRMVEDPETGPWMVLGPVTYDFVFTDHVGGDQYFAASVYSYEEPHIMLVNLGEIDEERGIGYISGMIGSHLEPWHKED